MRVLYFDCGMGAAGDMLASALLELLPAPESFLKELNALEIPGVHIKKEYVTKCGIGGTHLSVTIHNEEESEDMRDDQYHAYPRNCREMKEQIQLHRHYHADDNETDHHHEHGSEENHYHSHYGHGNGENHHHIHHNHGGGTNHHHRGPQEIKEIIDAFRLSEKVKQDILQVYSLIAEAESHAHGVPVTEIHFHEVGMMDAIADITAVCMLMDRIAPEKVVVSPIHVGSGHVKCAHGILPVPAPATAYILKDAPIYGGEIKSELCTPTGAALLKYFAAQFGSMPIMKTQAIGYGMGKKDFPMANCVRVFLGETAENSNDAAIKNNADVNHSKEISNTKKTGNQKEPDNSEIHTLNDTIVELNCNIDDMTPEAISFAMERFFDAGALEAYTVPAVMKKSRMGTLLTVLCRESDKEKLIHLIFKHTTTIGMREKICQRYILKRTVQTEQTCFGKVRKKISSGYGVVREKYEYEDLAEAARKNDLSISEVIRKIEENSQNTKC